MKPELMNSDTAYIKPIGYRKFSYIVGVEYACELVLFARDEDSADSKAREVMSNWPPSDFVPPKQYRSMVYCDQDFGASNRVYEAFETL